MKPPSLKGPRASTGQGAESPRRLPLLELSPALRQGAADQPLCFTWDGHWNAEGQQLAARALAEGLAPQLQRSGQTSTPSL